MEKNLKKKVEVLLKNFTKLRKKQFEWLPINSLELIIML